MRSWLTVIALAIPAVAGELRLLPEGLPLRLEVLKTGLWSGRKHQFEFARYAGRLEFDPSEPARSREMLDAGRCPTIEFRSVAVEPLGGDRYRVRGQLQIRGVSKPIQFEVHADREDTGFLVEGRSLFRMSEFGLKPPPAALGLIGTKDEVSLEFRIRVRP